MVYAKESCASPEEELSVVLLREFFLTATHTLSVAIGFPCAMRLLKQYSVASGPAAANYLQDFTGLRSKDVHTITILEGAGNSWSLGGKAQIWASEDVGILEVAECKTNGLYRGACIQICQYLCNSFCDFIDSRCSAELVKTLSNGDDLCRWEFKIDRGKSEHSGSKYEVYSLPEISRDEHMNYAHQTLGELWIVSTRVMVEQLGSSKALALLKKPIKDLAIGWADRIGRLARVSGESLEDANKVRSLLSSTFQRRVEFSLGDDEAKGCVEECPLSEVPPEACYQYHIFLNGVLEALMIPYTFKCDSMMTQGDQNCQWNIKRIASMTGLREEYTRQYESPLDLLKKRYVLGELSVDQYRQMKRILEE